MTDEEKKVEETKVEEPLTEEEKAKKREETKKAILDTIKQKVIKDSGMSEQDAAIAMEMLDEANMPVELTDEDFKLGPRELDIRKLSEENKWQMLFRVTLLNGVYLRNLMKSLNDVINLMFVELDAMGVKNIIKTSDQVMAKVHRENNELVAKEILEKSKKRN